MKDGQGEGATDRRVGWLRKMIEIRLFEEKVQELFMKGLIQGTTHLAQGQEGVSVGAIAAMREDDVLTMTYRGHGQALARGMDSEAAFAELMGRASGCCGGVGGSMHFTDFSKGLIGAFAIVGAGLPVAVGAAMSARMQGKDSVALTFFGDGSTNIGTFHESLNMASIWKAPVIFIIENNLYGEYTPLRETTPHEDLAIRAQPFQMPGIVVDGQDVGVVHDTVAEAIERARRGDGPSLLEMKTYRFRGHSRSDPAKYRPEGELDRWKARDPITILGARLAEESVLSEDDQKAAWDDIQSQIDAAADRAAEAPFPTLEETHRYVYAD
ncbi:MAG: thiamine pyrophosphate-dependent dehydrogenase E1 component subunit alpha [Chloroflexi bacterium]|jgi:pyruvate dehydrogenase E1 component alpha subunit|nr:thiamine pyrophosphate-dependent dehydrogenase E1 component subunit alpha [Chloroflexota bacterium]